MGDIEWDRAGIFFTGMKCIHENPTGVARKLAAYLKRLELLQEMQNYGQKVRLTQWNNYILRSIGLAEVALSPNYFPVFY